MSARRDRSRRHCPARRSTRAPERRPRGREERRGRWSSVALRLVGKRDAEREAILTVPWSSTGPARFDAVTHLDILQLRAARRDHFAQRVMKINPATLTEGIVAIEPRDVSERLPLGILPRALSLFQHFDDQLVDFRIQLFKRSLPAHWHFPLPRAGRCQPPRPFLALRHASLTAIRSWAP